MFGERKIEPGIYEAVYGGEEEEVKARIHERVGGNAFVDSTLVKESDVNSIVGGMNQEQHMKIIKEVPLNEEQGTIVNITKEA